MYASISRVCKYIEDQNQKWLQLEQSKNRKDDLSEVEDPRVDLCIFCLPPHRQVSLGPGTWPGLVWVVLCDIWGC